MPMAKGVDFHSNYNFTWHAGLTFIFITAQNYKFILGVKQQHKLRSFIFVYWWMFSVCAD